MAIRVSHSKINLLQSQDQRLKTKRCLCPQEIERLDGVLVGDTIFCTNGVLWVTQEGDQEDYLLRKGEKFVANREGLVLVQALDYAACRWLENHGKSAA